MYRWSWYLMLTISLYVVAVPVAGQDSNAAATCNFDRTKQIAVRYQRFPLNSKKKLLGHEIPYGKLWAPGDKPLVMFTNTALSIDDKDMPIGAYTLFIIPEEKVWTLIISKSTDTSGTYNEQQDLARIPMQLGQLSRPETQFKVSFAHVAPDQCNIRLYLQKTGAFATFKEKK